MVTPRVLYAILALVILTGPQHAPAAGDQVTPAMLTPEPQLLGSLTQSPPEKLQPFEVRATDSSLHQIAKWLSANFELPYTDELPRIARVTPLRLQQLRYRPLFSAQGGGEPVTPGYQREVVALYDTSTKTIYLPESWTGASVAEQSVLVHEMVHHLQTIANLKFACAGERERPAYVAQDRWLRQHGLELAKEFEVDMFTVVAMSACMD